MDCKKNNHGDTEVLTPAATRGLVSLLQSIRLRASVVIITFLLLFFCSCGSNDSGTENDSLSEDSLPVETLTRDGTAPVVNETAIPYKLSPEDSTRVADSVAMNRNPVRDFE